MEGVGIMWSGWKLMSPGISAASEMESATMRTKSFLADGVKSASQLGAEMQRVSDTAYRISERMPIAAAAATVFQNALLKEGFSADLASGSAETALSLAQLRGSSEESTRGMMELFRGQFGVDTTGTMNAALDWAAQTGADPDEILAALQRSGLTMAAHEVSLNSAISMAGLLKEAKLAKPGALMDSMMESITTTWADTESQQARWAQRFGLSFFNGSKFIGFAALQKQLKQQFKNIDPARRDEIFKNVFGGGHAVAEKLFVSQDLQEFEDAAQKNAGAIAALKEQLSSLENSSKTLGNSWRNMLAAMYTPTLPTLAAGVQGLNTLTSGIGGWARKHSTTAAIGGVALGGITGLGMLRALYGSWGMVKSALSLRVGLKQFGMSILGTNSLIGAAAGRAQEAVTGVKPVFVTNWPTGGIAGLAAPGGLVDQFGRPFQSAGGAALGAASGGMVSKVMSGAGMTLAESFAAAPALTVVGGLIGTIAAAKLGYALGERLRDPLWNKIGDLVSAINQTRHQDDGLSPETKERYLKIRIDTYNSNVSAETNDSSIKLTDMPRGGQIRI